MDHTDSERFVLRADDEVGQEIKECRVNAIVYGPDFWADTDTIICLITEDNHDAEVQNEESELEAF